MYVLIFTLSGGILPWRHLPVDDHNQTSVKSGVMASSYEFSHRVVSYIPKECWGMLNCLRELVFAPDYNTQVTCTDFVAGLHL